MMTLEKCPTHEELHALSLGMLSEERSDDILGHLPACETCQAELNTASQMDDTLVGQLRESEVDEAYQEESDCQLALVKALGALANANSSARSDAEISALLPKVLGEYEIVRPLGRGGMGTVYLARHSKLGRQVALKVLSSERLLQPRMRQRFETEMRAVGQLSHPNIVTAHDAREVDDVAVLVTEFIDGLDVSQIVKRAGKLSVANACEIARQTALALDYVGQQGLVHRDIKPSNVMLGKEGEVKLLDLGLARLQLDADERVEMTATGQAMGTADYVAPEQVNDSRLVDLRADIYALGCTLFKMLSGDVPFPDDRYPTAFAKMTAHVSDEPPSLEAPEVPPELAKLVLKMMSKQPVDRPQTAKEIAELLKKFCDGADLKQLLEDVLALPETGGSSPSRPSGVPRSSVPETNSFFGRKVPRWLAIAAGFGGFVLGLLLGVIITINHADGTQSKVELPNGATAKVSPEGNVEINLPGEKQPTQSSYEQLDTENGNDQIDVYVEGNQMIVTSENPMSQDDRKTIRPVLDRLQGVWSVTDLDQKVGQIVIAFRDLHYITLINGEAVGDMPYSFNSNGKIIQIVIEGPNEMNIEGVIRFGGDDKIALRTEVGTIELERAAKFPITSDQIEKLVQNPETALLAKSVAKIAEYVKKNKLTSNSDADTVKELRKEELVLGKNRLEGVWRATDLDQQVGQLVVVFRGTHYITLINGEAAGEMTYSVMSNSKFMTLQVQGPNEMKIEAVVQFEGADKLIMRTEAGSTPFKRIATFPITAKQITKLGENPETALLVKPVQKIAEYATTGEFPITPRMAKVREAAFQSRSRNNLKQIGLAMHNFADKHKLTFPSAHTEKQGDKTIKRSWRVAILPYIGEEELYHRFHLDEDWDSEHNIKLLDQMPEVYRLPGAKEDSTETPYLAVVGPNTVISDPAAGMRDILDGTSKTIMVLETKKMVPWTKPEDLAFDAEKDLPALAPIYEGGVHASVADGSVKFLKTDTSNDDLKAFFTRDGHENIKIP